MTIVPGSIGVLRKAWDEFDAAERESQLAKAERHALFVGAALADLGRGLPEVVTQFDRPCDEAQL